MIDYKHVYLGESFQDNVTSDVIQSHRNGLSVPCLPVLFNNHILFGSFSDFIQEQYNNPILVTGHYARIGSTDMENTFPIEGMVERIQNIKYRNQRRKLYDWAIPSRGEKLLRAYDLECDQTFELSQITQKVLQNTVFPIGDIPGDVVQDIAMKQGLGDCITREGWKSYNYPQQMLEKLLSKEISPTCGNFVHVETAEKLGPHSGIHNWNIGDKATVTHSNAPDGYYVSSIDETSGNITVAPSSDHPSLFCETFKATLPQFITNQPPNKLIDTHMLDCQICLHSDRRYIDCTIIMSATNSYCGHDHINITLQKPERAIRPGQHVSLYLGEECLGWSKIIRTGPSVYDMNYNKIN